MSTELTKAQAQRILDLTTYCQRLAAVLNIPAPELLEGLAMCNLTLLKDDKDVVTDHMDVIAWAPHKGTAT
jgi:hypothetical protein